MGGSGLAAGECKAELCRFVESVEAREDGICGSVIAKWRAE
jgi:hypothetical protein